MRYAAHLTILPPSETNANRFLHFLLTEIDSPIVFDAAASVVYEAAPGATAWTLVSVKVPGEVHMTAHVAERTGRILVSLARIYETLQKGPDAFLAEINRSWGKQVVYIEDDKKWVAVEKLKNRQLTWRPTDPALEVSSEALTEEKAQSTLANVLSVELVTKGTSKERKKAILDWLGDECPVTKVGGAVVQFVSRSDFSLVEEA